MWRQVVDGFNSYRLRSSKKFDTTFQSVIKKHYRKDKKNRQAFKSLIQRYVEVELTANPCGNEISDAEPFPDNSYRQNCQLRKKRWRNLPVLRGKSKYGRLIFLVDTQTKIVHLLWLYTHSEFPKRPPEKALGTAIDQIE